jgi:bla regulator protein BlaR1
VEALRRLERIAGVRNRVEILLSGASLEPGIFGVARPVLVWPEGISEHLEVAHLEAILAHELWHVRRRDNLAAAIHMTVEAIFWFHPLVWWLGARMVDERERACDEEVLELGSERQISAESILKVCEFCVGSPLACVSGVTGADLKKRMVHIMSEHVVRKLDLSKTLLLSSAGLAALAVPIVFGLANATQIRAQAQAENIGAGTPVYEVASINPTKSGNAMFFVKLTPDGLTATTTLQMLIRAAYGVEDNQVSGAPKWLSSEKYDVEAKMDSSVADELRKLSEDQRELTQKGMLQALLTDRLKLTIHRETTELPEYSLVIAENGPKLQKARPGDTYANGPKGFDGHPAGPHTMFMERGQLTGQGLPMTSFVRLLTQQLGSTVLDKTGLTGNYDFMLRWTPDESRGAMFNVPEGGPQSTDKTLSPESSGPSIFTAIQEQLGLKLESQRGPVEILVIDHVEKPSED